MKRGRTLKLAAVAVASAWLSIAGCTAVLGLDDKSFDGLGGSSGVVSISVIATTTSSSSSGSSTGAGGCDDGVPSDAGLFACGNAGCLQLPCGWSGPVFLTNEATTCATDAGDFGWFTAPTVFAPSAADTRAECQCSCSNIASCQLAELTIYEGDSCTGNFVSTSLDKSCMMFGHDGGRSATLVPDLTCFPDAGVVNPMVEDAGRLCSPTSITTCGAHGVCVPASPFDGGVGCLYKQTAHVEACPAGFPTRYLVGNQGFSDERACNDCECPPIDPADCVGDYAQLANNPSCAAPNAKVDAGGCAALDAGYVAAAKLMPVPAKNFCGDTLAPGSATGDIQPAKGSASMYTVCCPPK